MSFILLIIPVIACALIVMLNRRDEKFVENHQPEKAIASSLLQDFFVPLVLVGCAVIFYGLSYLVFPIN